MLGALAILLVFAIVVLQSRLGKSRRDVKRLKEDFTSYRRDMRTKVPPPPFIPVLEAVPDR